jgi:uncharacterized repeat protein (TIGR03803 family)
MSIRLSSVLTFASIAKVAVGIAALLFGFEGNGAAQVVTVIHIFRGTDGSAEPIRVQLEQGRDGKLYGNTYGYPISSGTVFRVDVNGKGIAFHQFDGVTGSRPEMGVTLGTDGNFYGTTITGGALDKGVLFRINPSGQYAVLHEFSGGLDGEYPVAPPIEASDGNFYGTTYGNVDADPTIYKYTRSGLFTTIYNVDQAHGQFVNAPLIQAADGLLYGTATGGGAYNCGTILKLTVSGTLLNYYSFPCGAGGSSPIAPLFQAADGNFYSTTSEGGIGPPYGYGTVFKMNPKGVVTILHAFAGSPLDGYAPDGTLVQATDGNFYGTAGGGSFDGGVLFRLMPDGTFSIIYSFSRDGAFGDDGTLVQHTNGLLYGTTNNSQPYGTYGAVFSLDMGLGPFITFVQANGKVGQTAQILGQGLTGSTSVTFNGVPATTFLVGTDTYIRAVVPSAATTGPVVVTTPKGTLTSNKDFRIVR